MTPDLLVGLLLGCCAGIAASELAWGLADRAVRRQATLSLRRSSIPRSRW